MVLIGDVLNDKPEDNKEKSGEIGGNGTQDLIKTANDKEGRTRLLKNAPKKLPNLSWPNPNWMIPRWTNPRWPNPRLANPRLANPRRPNPRRPNLRRPNPRWANPELRILRKRFSSNPSNDFKNQANYVCE